MRKVPVKLQAGKLYVTQGGLLLRVVLNPAYNPDITCPRINNAGCKFIGRYEPDRDGVGAAFYHEDGMSQLGDQYFIIARPAYVAGETYVDVEGKTWTLCDNPHDTPYPLKGVNHLRMWTEVGTYWVSSPHSCDLMDYAPAVVEAVSPIAEVMVDIQKLAAVAADPWVGKRVQFEYQGLRATGLVCEQRNGEEYAVRLDEEHKGNGHACNDTFEWPHASGWWVAPGFMTELLCDAPVGVSPVVEVMQDIRKLEPVAPALVLDPLPPEDPAADDALLAKLAPAVTTTTINFGDADVAACWDKYMQGGDMLTICEARKLLLSYK